MAHKCRLPRTGWFWPKFMLIKLIGMQVTCTCGRRYICEYSPHWNLYSPWWREITNTDLEV